MTGKPPLNERQQALFKQAKNCREFAQRIRSAPVYEQNNPCRCALEYNTATSFGHELGLYDNSWDLFGFTRDHSSESKCTHDGTKEGAAQWLEEHAAKLESQV